MCKLCPVDIACQCERVNTDRISINQLFHFSVILMKTSGVFNINNYYCMHIRKGEACTPE